LTITTSNAALYYRISQNGPARIVLTFSCKIKSASGGLEYEVTAANGSAFTGAVKISFYDYKGSGDVFFPVVLHHIAPGGSLTNWHAVPPTDIGASAAPSGCVAKAIGG
jgi:hypothetical protein